MSKPRYIAHTGGKMPIDANIMCEVVFVGGSLAAGLSDRFYWHRDGDLADIIAYRVIK